MTKKSTDLEVIPSVQTSELRKAIEAIAIKPLAGKITLLTRRLNNVLLAEAQAQGINQSVYRIPLSKLCSKSEYGSSNMMIIKDQLRKMASTMVEWNTGVKGSRRWGTTSLIGVEIIEEGNRCFIEWSYQASIKDKLLSPDIYARLSLHLQNKFRSGAALALYEICARYAESPAHLTMRMPWEEWRPTLSGNPDGETEGKYIQYKYFKRDVIKPAINEVNTLTDIEVELIEHKVKGKTVADLQFNVRLKNQNVLALDEPNPFDLSLINRIVGYGFTQAQAEKFYSDNDEIKLRAVLDYVDKRLKNTNSPIENVQGYFRDALTKGYGIGAKIIKDKASTVKTIGTTSVKNEEKANDTISKLKLAWDAEKRKAVLAQYKGLDDDNKRQVMEDFISSGINKFTLTKVRKSGLETPVAEKSFIDWCMKKVNLPTDGELLQFGLENGLIATLGK